MTFLFSPGALRRPAVLGLTFGLCIAVHSAAAQSTTVSSVQPVTSGSSIPASDVAVGKSYVYKTVGKRELHVYVFGLRADALEERRPAMVYFHGGGWVRGGVNQFDRQVEYLAGRGIVGMQVEYRFANADIPAESTTMLPLQDAQSAMRWVRSHAAMLGIDPNRIAAVGASAGGQMAAYVGMMDGGDDPTDNKTVSSRPNMIVLFNPAIDLAPGTCCGAFGGDDYRSVSPRYHVHAGVPPMIIMQGASDELVSPKMIREFAGKMKLAGNDCELDLYPGIGHRFFYNSNFNDTLLSLDKFLAAHGWVKGAPDVAAIDKLPVLKELP